MSIRGAVHGVLFDAVMGWVDLRFAATRDAVCGAATGQVLEIGAGSGRNLPHFPGAVSLSAIEPDAELRARYVKRAARLHRSVSIHAAPGEALPFDDAAFDTVVTTLVLCSVEDPDAVVAEIRRVLSPGGVLRFAEHVRSPDPGRAERQDRWAPLWCRCSGGCRPNRDTLRTIERGGFTVQHMTRSRMRGAPQIVRPLIVGAAQSCA